MKTFNELQVGDLLYIYYENCLEVKNKIQIGRINHKMHTFDSGREYLYFGVDYILRSTILGNVLLVPIKYSDSTKSGIEGMYYIYYIFSDEDEFLEEVNKHNKDV